jgi:hypothetical protein
MVEDEIAVHHAGQDGFEAWQRDREQISSLITTGRIAATSVIASTPS